MPAELSGLTEIVVTFERMDPLGRKGPGIVDLAGTPAWIVSIADLLMVASLLTDAPAFHHYARVRAEMAVSGPAVYMESDALAAYIRDRVARVRARAAAEPDTTVMLGYSSGPINRYFTDLELGTEAQAPTVGVPGAVVEALSRTAMMGAGRWAEAVEEVMAATPQIWVKLRSFRRRHHGKGTFWISDRVEIVFGSPGITELPDGRIRVQVPGDKRESPRATGLADRQPSGGPIQDSGKPS